MYADPHALIALADELRARARSVRRLAATADHDAAAAIWHGASAEAMRQLSRRACDSLLALADQHDQAAELVTEHAHRVLGRLDVAAGAVGAVGAVGALGALRWLEDAA